MIRKTTAQRLIAGTVALLALGYLGNLWAGTKTSSPVSVTAATPTSVGAASGALGSARNSADANQYIGCRVYMNVDDDEISVTCSARNSANVTVSCISYQPKFVEAVHAMNSDSWILFNFDTFGQCTRIFVDNSSKYAPKNP